MQRMGGLGALAGMMPGMKGMKGAMDKAGDDKALVHLEAMMSSMTAKERARPELINAKRKIRIAKGSGTTVQEVNKLLKMHQEMANAMKRLKKMGGLGKLAAMFGKGGLEGALGGLAPGRAAARRLGGGGAGLPGLGGAAVQPSAWFRQVLKEITELTERNRQMAVAIRLARGGAKKRPYYRIVVADSRDARDGRFIEKLGTYNPLLAKDSPERVKLDADRISHWLSVGAQPSDRVLRFLDAAGIRSAPARNNPKKGEPGEKAKERVEERAAKAAEAAEAAAAPAEEPGRRGRAAEEVAAEQAPAERPTCRPRSRSPKRPPWKPRPARRRRSPKKLPLSRRAFGCRGSRGRGRGRRGDSGRRSRCRGSSGRRAANEGESAQEPAEGADEAAPPTEDSPQPAEAAAEGESAEEPAEGAAEDAKA